MKIKQCATGKGGARRKGGGGHDWGSGIAGVASLIQESKWGWWGSVQVSEAWWEPNLRPWSRGEQGTTLVGSRKRPTSLTLVSLVRLALGHRHRENAELQRRADRTLGGRST